MARKKAAQTNPTEELGDVQRLEDLVARKKKALESLAEVRSMERDLGVGQDDRADDQDGEPDVRDIHFPETPAGQFLPPRKHRPSPVAWKRPRRRPVDLHCPLF
jgi:hypothetical protein